MSKRKIPKPVLSKMLEESQVVRGFTPAEKAMVLEAWNLHGIQKPCVIARNLFPDLPVETVVARIRRMGLRPGKTE